MAEIEDRNDTVNKTVLKFITFGLGREKFGIAIDKVKEIIADYEIVPLPRTPDFIEGIISLRGDIIPVVEMRARFDMPPREDDEETRVIVLEMRDFAVGIQVDNVYEVLKLAEDAIEPPPRFMAGLKGDYIDGVAEAKGRLTIILNLDEIFSTTEKIAMREGVDSGVDIVTDVETEMPRQEAAPPTPTSTTKGEPRRPTVTVSLSGQIGIRGKNYYVGKKYAGDDVSIEEAGSGVKVFFEGVKIKEFKA
ncbi:MAG: chemotaxis protein CheW [bacterium]|nr:chemotaxis protein CheW [bacterium]